MEDLTTDERKELFSSFHKKIKDEGWFDRPTALHGHFTEFHQFLTHWVVTGLMPDHEGRPIFGIIRKMITEHAEKQGVGV